MALLAQHEYTESVPITLCWRFELYLVSWVMMLMNFLPSSDISLSLFSSPPPPLSLVSLHPPTFPCSPQPWVAASCGRVSFATSLARRSRLSRVMMTFVFPRWRGTAPSAPSTQSSWRSSLNPAEEERSWSCPSLRWERSKGKHFWAAEGGNATECQCSIYLPLKRRPNADYPKTVQKNVMF